MARIKQIYHTYPNNQQIANIYQQYHLTPALSTASAGSVSYNTLSIRALKQQLRQQPDNADIIGTLGVRYSRANQRAPAIYYLSQALTLSPNTMIVICGVRCCNQINIGIYLPRLMKRY
ncbi:hypothetical protein IC611_18300 [Proteus mirabilis]